MKDAVQFILVVIGATPEGKKELATLSDGYRESEASWKELLLDLKIDPHFNNHRTHQLQMHCGRTPMATLLDSKTVWKENKFQAEFKLTNTSKKPVTVRLGLNYYK